MKLLLLADLHDCRPWYDWVVAQAPQYDLVAVSGGLLDMFGVDQRGQIEFLREKWLPAMRRTRVPVALCSGNHDGPAAMWLSDLSQADGVVGDGATALFEPSLWRATDRHDVPVQ